MAAGAVKAVAPQKLRGALAMFALACTMAAAAAESGSGAAPGPTPAPPAPPSVHADFQVAGGAAGQCVSASGGAPLRRQSSRPMVCIGFEPVDSAYAGQPGQKAVFFPLVDEYASLSLDTLEPAVAAVEGTEPANWPYAYMWVGVEDKRTIGQTRGRVVNAGAEDEACVPCTPTGTEEGECALPAGVGNGTEAPCYGWRLHNKPVMAGGHWLLTGVTVIVHLDRGVVTRVVYDNGCTLCDGMRSELACKADNTSVVCPAAEVYGGAPAECRDCYLKLGSGCGENRHACAPKIYIAWVGTDVDGNALLSAGSVLSRFGGYSLQGVYDTVYKEVAEVGAIAE